MVKYRQSLGHEIKLTVSKDDLKVIIWEIFSVKYGQWTCLKTNDRETADTSP